LAVAVRDLLCRPMPDGRERLVAILELEYEDFVEVDRQEWFCLLSPIRDEYSLSKLVPGVPVLLELALRSRVSDTVLPSLRVRGLKTIFDSGQPDEALLRPTENWLALNVAQMVPVEGAGGTRLVKHYYKTLWKGIAREVRALMHNVVAETLQTLGYAYERHSDQLYALRHQRGGRSWRGLVFVDESAEICACYSILPRKVPPKLQKELCQRLMDINYQLRRSNFELDAHDGELRLRSALDLAQEPLSPSRLERLLLHNLDTFELHWDLILELLEPSSNP